MKVFINLLLLLLSYSAFGIESYSKGDELYIWAISGLNLRSAPDATSSKIVNIPYGARVSVVDMEIQAHAFSYKMVNTAEADWIVDGHWVQVAFNGQTGYVFDGYLCRFPPISSDPTEVPYLRLDLIKAYGQDHWGGLLEETRRSTVNFEDQQRDPDKGRSSSYQLTFKNGSYYQNEEESFSGSTRIFIKDISIEEAYLFFNILTGFEYQQKVNAEHGDPHPGTQLSIKDGQLNFLGSGMNMTTLRKTEGGVIIESGGGC